MAKKNLTGIILAGGKGIRLGRNKGLALLKERHLIEYVIENLTQVCDEILISSNTDHCDKFGFKAIPDIYEAKGPMAGIHACLTASSNEDNFVVSVDTPFVSPDFIKYMLSQKENNRVVAPWYGSDHFEPLCAYYSKKILDIMDSFFRKGNYKLPDLFKEVSLGRVSVENMPFQTDKLFHNINTNEDLALAEKYLEKNA